MTNDNKGDIQRRLPGHFDRFTVVNACYAGLVFEEYELFDGQTSLKKYTLNEAVPPGETFTHVAEPNWQPDRVVYRFTVDGQTPQTRTLVAQPDHYVVMAFLGRYVSDADPSVVIQWDSILEEPI